LAFLAEASSTLASSLDYHLTLAAVSKLAVPRLADWCAVDVVEPDGSLRRVAVVHTDPAKVALAYELQRRYPPDPETPRGVYHVLRTGQAEFYPEISDSLLEATGLDEEQLHIIRELGLKSAITVPMLARDRAFGAITFVLAESGRHYDEADLALAEELAGRAVLAIDNARLHQETKKANEELERRVLKRTAQLEAANKELEAFSYSVSHDLRAPLRSIDGFSQALLEDYGDRLGSEAQHYLRRVRAGSQRMAELIDDLLTLSRMTRSEMRLENVSLSSLAQTIATGLRETEPEREVKFIIVPEATVEADRQLMRVVLENLLGNAWKFTARQAAACIEFGTWPQAGGQPAYFVRDDGAGFDMAYADKLFGAFQRLHTPAEFSGTGIGLATVQRIIHRHGGRVWAEGAVEEGATFYFTLGSFGAPGAGSRQ
jgi:signal transduction histidine kinase